MVRASSSNSAFIAASGQTDFYVEDITPFFVKRYGLPNTLFVTMRQNRNFRIRLQGSPKREFQFLGLTSSEVEVGDKEEFSAFRIINDDASNAIDTSEFRFSFGRV